MTAEAGSGSGFGMKRGKVYPVAQARSLLNPLRRLVQSPRRTVAAMALSPAAKVLELGCGPGFFSPFIAQAVPRGIVVLVDLQFDMLLLARERLSASSNARYLQSDASLLPLRAACFDAVLLATTLGEVPNQDVCVEEIGRVLRPGGIVTVVETRRDSDFVAFPKLYELFGRHDFVFIDRRGRSWQFAARFRTRRAAT